MPDVIGHTRIELPYPTEAVDVVVEILSPNDKAGLALDKCARYTDVGVRAISVLDPERRKGWQWNAERGSLDEISIVRLPNGRSISLENVWREMQKFLDTTNQ